MTTPNKEYLNKWQIVNFCGQDKVKYNRKYALFGKIYPIGNFQSTIGNIFPLRDMTFMSDSVVLT